MKYTSKLTNLGIEFSFHEGEAPGFFKPAVDANQQQPRQNYVYAHIDRSEQIFYVGKGTGRRAWSIDRHPLWSRYVEKHLNGEYQIRILHDNLTANEAEILREAEWIAQCSETIVNWVNMGRKTDFEALDRRNRLRDENLALIQQAKTTKKHDLEQAASMYMQAIEAIQTYAYITYEKGLVGQLIDEETAELGVSGELKALDRLTICLTKLGKHAEAHQQTEKYFALYRRDQQYVAAKRITKRVTKELACKNK